MPDQNEGARLSHTIVRSVIPGRGNAVAALAVRVDAATRPGMRHQTLPPALWGQASATLGKVREWLRSEASAEIAHEADGSLMFPGTRIDHAPLWVADALGLPEFQRFGMIRMTGGANYLANRPMLEYLPTEDGEVTGPRRHGVFLDHGDGLIRKLPSSLAAFHTRMETVAGRPDSRERLDGFQRALRDFLPGEAFRELRANGQVRLHIAGNMRVEQDVVEGRLTRAALLTVGRGVDKPLLQPGPAETFHRLQDAPLASDIPGVIRLVQDHVLVMSEPLRLRVSTLRDFRALPPDEREAIIMSRRELPPDEAAAWETSAFGPHVTGYSFWERPRMRLLVRRPYYGGFETTYVHSGDGVVAVRGQAAEALGVERPADIAGAVEGMVVVGEQAMDALQRAADDEDRAMSAPVAEEAADEGGPEIPAAEGVLGLEGDDIGVGEAGAVMAADLDALRAAAGVDPRKRALMVRSNIDALERVAEITPRPVDAGITVEAVMARLVPDSALKPHQADALRRLAAAYASGAPGRILADDPGLGKTLAVLCLVAWLAMQRSGPVLVVVPNDVAEVWKKQAAKHFSGRLLPDPEEAYGALFTRASGGDLYDRLSRIRTRAWTLTTYDTLRRHAPLLASIRFSAVVFDEGQLLKNPLTFLRRAATSLNAGFGVMVSGTPIENGLSELWSIVDLVWPGRLGTLADFSARETGEGGADDVDARIEAFARELARELTLSADEPPGVEAGMLLRRTKNDVLDLPVKELVPEPAYLTPEQVEAYDRIDRLYPRGGPVGFRRLAEFRQASLHPDPLEGRFDNLPARMTDAVAEGFIERSASFSHARDVLQQTVARGERSIVSVHFVVRQIQAARTLGHVLDMGDLPFINGDMSVERRKAVVAAWQADKRAVPLLITPGTGGLGLTLVEANHVIHLSRWYNPAREIQVEDRVHRIGQELPVSVHYCVASHPNLLPTYDLFVEGLQRTKRAIAEEFFRPFEAVDVEAAARRYFGQRLAA